jgi:DNA polymerase-2
LPSKIHRNVPVLSRYYGVFRNGKIKDRGIATRRSDTPPIINRCMREMLSLLAEAENVEQFHQKLRTAIEVVEKYIEVLRSGDIPLSELVIRKRLSHDPSEYQNMVLYAMAARQLAKEGASPKAGETVSYIIMNSRSKFASRRVLAVELCEDCPKYDDEAYVDLLVSAVETMLMSFDAFKRSSICSRK